MFIERVISLNNGWSILRNKAEEWAEITSALDLIDKEVIDVALKVLREDNKEEGYYMVPYIYGMYNTVLREIFEWRDPLPAINGPEEAPLLLRCVKNGVSASIPGIDEKTGGDWVSTLYLTIPYYFNTGVIEVAVILIPTGDAISYFLDRGIKDSQLQQMLTEQIYRAQAVKFSSLISKAPIVLAFFSSTNPEEITVEDATPLKIGGHTIERTLEFAPEYYQASVGLLSYFGEILRQKDPQTKAKVRIEQDGNRVRLHIESPSGDIEIIEKQLEQYALVVSKQALPESLLENAGQIVQLKAQLRVAQLQVETAHDVRLLLDGNIARLEKQVDSQQKQLDFLQTQFAAQVLQKGQVIELVGQQASSHERMQAALLTHAQFLFKDLLEESRSNYQLHEAIQSLHQNLLSGLTTIDVEDQIKRALDTVKQTKPGLLSRIYSQVEGAAMKAGAGASLGWAAELIKHAQV